jgi:hypothetical protein
MMGGGGGGVEFMSSKTISNDKKLFLFQDTVLDSYHSKLNLKMSAIPDSGVLALCECL